MQYGVPQLGWSKGSGRVKILKLWADSAGEELFLTRLYEALERSEPVQFVATFQDGSSVEANFQATTTEGD